MPGAPGHPGASRRPFRLHRYEATENFRAPSRAKSSLQSSRIRPHNIPCIPIATSSIADAAESRKIVTAQTTTNAVIMSGLVSR